MHKLKLLLSRPIQYSLLTRLEKAKNSSLNSSKISDSRTKHSNIKSSFTAIQERAIRTSLCIWEFSKTELLKQMESLTSVIEKSSGKLPRTCSLANSNSLI